MADGHVVALSGGVGGAKLALGLSRILPPDRLTIVANTGDDFTHLGLTICPDLDTVMYTLADLSNKEAGWGLAGESWNFLDALSALGGEDWFRLGDRDLAPHITRTRWLAEGRSLSTVTGDLCRRLGVAHPIVPMSDDPVPTIVELKDGGDLAFQHYFVRDQCEPVVAGFRFEGIERAAPAAGFADALARSDLDCVVICPSNPFVSVDPVLKLPGVQAALDGSDAPVVAVSPIVGGQALTGPAAKMMDELGMPRDPVSVARHYAGRIDGLVIDEADPDSADSVREAGPAATVTQTVMVTLADRMQLAEDVVSFAATLRP